MKQCMNKALQFLLTAVLALGLAFCASAAQESGQCGEQVTWVFDPVTAEITISGSGPMTDCKTPQASPFYGREDVTALIIEEGVTSLGSFSFHGMSRLESITIPDTVTAVSASALEDCDNLALIIYGGDMAQWNAIAIADDNALLNGTMLHLKTHTTSAQNDAKAPTCTEAGIRPGVYCLGCDCWIVKRQTLPATGHTAAKLPGKEATCTETGLTEGSVCSVCGTVLQVQETIPLKDHTVENWEVTTEAACTAAGEMTGSCSYCKKVFTKEIAALGHTKVTLPAEEAACTKEGKTAGEACSRCGDVFLQQNTIPALGHDYGDYVTAKEATCFAPGEEVSSCSRCPEKRTREIPQLSHKLIKLPAVAPTCTTQGLTEGEKCAVCGTVTKAQTAVAKTPHKPKYVLLKASFDKKGALAKQCSVCGEPYEAMIIDGIGKITVSADTLPYIGNIQTPSVSVRDTRGSLLTRNMDYDVTYSATPVQPGNYTLTITFKGYYEGEKTYDFSILPGRTAKISAEKNTSAIRITWDKVPGATGYKVYQYNPTNKTWKYIATTAGNTYLFTGLPAGTSYRYAVRAFTKTAKGVLVSDTYTSYTTSTKPVAPTLKASTSSGKVNLSWNKVSGATGYQIFWSTDGVNYTKLTNASATKYTKSLKKGTTVYFKVRAYKKVSNYYVYSTFSDVKKITVK
ncbi:MAG: fibronectin type III domain-containing protein [Acutalibacteraceae bacterium]